MIHGSASNYTLLRKYIIEDGYNITINVLK